jgi:hypothetical protein
MIFRIFTFGMAGLMGTALAVWTVDREPPIVITRTELLTPEVPAGGELKFHMWVTRYRSCKVSIDRLILDSAKLRFVLEDQAFERPPGPLGEDDYVNLVKVPIQTSAGSAVYRTITRYECNIIHRWFWPIVVGPSDLPFFVRGPEVVPLPVEVKP